MRRGAVALLLLLLAACTGGGSLGPFGSPTPSHSERSQAPPPSPPATSIAPPGTEPAAAALERLCIRAPAPKETPATPGPVPSAIQQVEQEVQQVRGLKYLHPVAVAAETHDQLVHGLVAPFDHDYPAGLLARRSRVWQLIGVIPADVELRQAYRAFLSGQVIGYYDPTSGQLVFIGTTNPSPSERLTLAHELTHADDDQHFDLSRLNPLENRCQDEAQMAATGAAFVQTLALWPYLDGLNFITALNARGGLAEVNRALQQFPVSTEQVMHPDRYPSDTPVAVNIPDYGPSLGEGWRDLDVMQVGEEWLRAMLELRLGKADAASAADGWGGGLYRAWTDGPHVAVELSTRWDTPTDADQFAAAVNRWLRSDQFAAVVRPAGEGSPVEVLFGSDAATLDALRGALGLSG